MIHDAPQDDAALEAVRRAVRGNTNQSFKKTFNSCLLIWIAGRQSDARRNGSTGSRRKIVSLVTAAGAAVAATVHYWGSLASFIGHVLHG